MKKVVVILCMAFFLSGCSVYMASTKEGTELSEVSDCETVTCLEINGAEHIKDGEDNTQYYKLRKPTGSIGRAAMHGVLDVFTLGLWEVAGTPMEGAYNTEKYYGLKVETGEEGENIKSMRVSN